VIRVVVESPYKGEVERNLAYLRACWLDCLRHGESPYSSHALYTQPDVLDDSVPEERELGIRAGFAWAEAADLRAFYVDLGVSDGMIKARNHAEELRQSFELRKLRLRSPEIWERFARRWRVQVIGA
jgi:hypothetical protein